MKNAARKGMMLIVLLLISFTGINYKTLQVNDGSVKTLKTIDSFETSFGITASVTDHLIGFAGTDFYVTVDSPSLIEANTEYYINITLEVGSFGVDVDRIYDIYLDVRLVWSGGSKNSTLRSMPEIDVEGGYETINIGVALNEGDFGSLSDNQIVPIEVYYYLILTEGVIGWSDEISYGLLYAFDIDYQNIMPIAIDGVFDVDLPPIYSDYGSKMGVAIRTNEHLITDKYFTFMVSLTAEEFPSDIDRFHSIEITLHFYGNGYHYSTSPSDVLEIALGETITYDSYLRFDDSLFGGLSIGEDVTVGLWYESYYKEGVILAIDPEYYEGPNYAYDFTLENIAEDTPVGTKQTHILELETSIVLSHMASKSIIFDGIDVWWNLTLFFAFNIYIETESTIILESYTQEQISTMDPFELYLLLKSQDIDVSIGAKPELGVCLNWINKGNLNEYSFEVRDLPVPTPIDVDGDGTSIEIAIKTIYLWDSPIWTNGSLTDTLGKLIVVQNGITIDLGQIDLMQYINQIASVSIPSWLLQLNLILAINVYPVIYQLLAFDYHLSGATLAHQDDGLLAFLDFDSTDSFDIDDLSKTAITPLTEAACSIEATPELFTYSYSKIIGSLDIDFELLGFSVYRATIINLVSSIEDSSSIESFASEAFTRNIDYLTTTPSPSPSPTPSPTQTDESGIYLLTTIVAIISTIIPIILIKKKRYR